ncbi:BAI1-associated protein 3 isoform X2 [Lingula anatina]|uniref:BAI1-associated protein 3 isoform X2 n=1 Tax=Lingula anatina TaxID=7574 RepID=A0A1S3HNM7_LINAN|nr:BAI1-associated protein 3 isoform X2 [Lingula anatina]|eukprot:XP_013387652.1 BAI1-associated protein 3 isoform X2 [Lingula anatina]
MCGKWSCIISCCLYSCSTSFLVCCYLLEACDMSCMIKFIHSVQEIDGNFFENFAALSWKQENHRLRTAHELQSLEKGKNAKANEADHPPPCETSVVPHPKSHKLSRKEFELLYIEVLYTIKHKIGTTSGGHSPYIHDLYQYAQESFRVGPEDHARLLAKASEEKPPIVILNVTVVEAKGLEAKDADGFSDPYCMLGIIPGSRLSGAANAKDEGFSSDEEKHHKKKNPLQKFSESLRKKHGSNKADKKEKLPAKYIQATTVKNNTLNPVWNEKFRFDLEDVNSDKLHIDIWDHDDESSVFEAAKKLNEVSGFKGFSRFFKQIAQSARAGSSGNVDDFLGCISTSLHDIPSTGIDKWFSLQGRKAKRTVQGQIRLKFHLATREDRGIPEEDNWTDVRQHEDLMAIFIEHEIQKCDEVYKWVGELPQAAQTILHQHAIQGDITPVQQAMCRWLSYSRKHMEHPFDYEYLLQVLEELEKSWEPGSLSRDEEESVVESFNIFIEYCLNLIRNMRHLFPPTNKAAYHRLEFVLKCLVYIYDMRLFKKCCPFQKDLHSEVVQVIKKGNLEWYEKINAQVKPITKSEEETINSLVELVNIINIDAHKAKHYYHPLFQSIVKVNYFPSSYKQIEKLLADDAGAILEEELADGEAGAEMREVSKHQSVLSSPKPKELGTTLFELYLALKEFYHYKDQLSHSDRKALTMLNYHEWFKGTLTTWFSLATQKLMNRTHKAVELDKELEKVEAVDPLIKHSTSAVDVCCCFLQMVEFWKCLSWPDVAGSYTFVTMLTDALCKAAKHYADNVHQKLKEAGYYDEIGQFDVTEQLCITINNIEQVRKALKPLPEQLHFAEIEHAVGKAHGEHAERQTRQALHKLIEGADKEMVQKIKQVVDRVADRMRPDIKKDVFHLCWAPEALPAEKAINHLMEYLDSNLLTLNKHLLRTNFERILDSIWVEVLEEIKEVIAQEEEGKTKSFYERLYDSCKILEDFFHAGKKGLSKTQLYSEQYRELLKLMEYNRSNTPRLIELYYQQRLEEQEALEKHEYGVLTVRVFYRDDQLVVEILHAKDVIPLDRNGLSDPYVLIELVPEHVFPDQEVQQTRVVKNNLNPLFEETFEYTVSKKQCCHHGASILFTVMDHDLLMKNDYAGEAIFSLNEVPGIHGEEVTGYEALKESHLPLTQPRPKMSGALSVLESRTDDKMAQDFVKKRRTIEEEAAANCKPES